MSDTIVFELFGISFPLNTALAYIGMIILVTLICVGLTRNLSVTNPSKAQISLESFIDFTNGIVRDNLGKQAGRPYFIISFGVFLFVILANYLGLPFLVHNNEGLSLWKSPTADIVVVLILSVMMNIISHYFGAKAHGGFGSYFKNKYLSPALPITIIEEIINMFTLAMRLFGNVLAGEILIGLIAQAGNAFGIATWTIGIPIQMAWQVFSLFIGGIQAYIFVTLSMVYISNKITQ